MKKIMIIAAVAFTAAVVRAASIGWSYAGMAGYSGDAYSLFVIGQNNVTDINTVTDILASGGDVSAYAFASGSVAANGSAIKMATAADAPKLDAGSYTSFFVLFDASAPTSGSSKYLVVSGLAKQNLTVGATAASATFAVGSIASQVSGGTWKSYGESVPEPTSGLLLLLGMAGLALKRKVA